MPLPEILKPSWPKFVAVVLVIFLIVIITTASVYGSSLPPDKFTSGFSGCPFKSVASCPIVK